MADTFFTRARRLVASGADELLTAAERRSALALAREAIRDMDWAIEVAQDQHARALAIVSLGEGKIAELEAVVAARGEDARYAFGRERPDLARRALAAQIEAEEAISAERERIGHARAEAEALAAAMPGLEARRRAMVDGVVVEPAGPTPAIDPNLIQRAAAAEAALARAATLAGEDAGVPGIDTLRREDEIAARLAALGADKPKAARRNRG